MTACVDVIVNCNAGGARERSELRASLTDAQSAAPENFRVHETRTMAELDACASAIAARGARAVVLVGGDGTVMASITAIARTWSGNGPLPAFAIVPAGTVGTIARNFGVPRGPAAARRLLHGAHNLDPANVLRTPTLRVRDDAGGDRIGFIFGAGLVARFFDLYMAAPRQGLVPAARIAASVFAGSLVGSPLAHRVLDPVPATLCVDGRELASRAWSLVVASVLRDLGLHLRPTYRAGLDPQRFHVVASGLDALALGRQLPRVLAGRPLTGEPRVDDLAASLRLTFAQGDGYVLDGDTLRARQVEVEPGPALTFVVESAQHRNPAS